MSIAHDQGALLVVTGPGALATWMGRLRELALARLQGPLLAALGSGRHGMVTPAVLVLASGRRAAFPEGEACT